MGKSIFEEYCEREQSNFLKATSNMTLAQAENFVSECISNYSFVSASGYILGFQLIFDGVEKKDAYSKKTILEIVQELKALQKKGLCDQLFDGYVECIARIFDFGVEEILRLLQGKEYWLSYGHYVKKCDM